MAARTGGGDPAGNPTLYDAIQKAKKNSVPNDNIERARKRGAGEEAGGADWQTITYEGYGPNGVAVLIECLTDNRNRAAGEVRVAMTRNGGNMADPGSVAYLFSRKGVVTLEKNGLTEDDVLTAVLDAGAEEVNDLGDSFEIICEPTDLVAVRTALQDAGIDYDSAEARFQPSVTVPVDADGARKVFKLVDALEDSDDVQDVYTNVDIPDEVLARARRLISARRTGAVGRAVRAGAACPSRVSVGRPRYSCRRTGVHVEGVGVRVMGVDPGLTRCGLSVIDGGTGRHVIALDVDVVRTPSDAPAAPAPADHQRRRRTLDGHPPPGRHRDRAGVLPAERVDRDGHRAGRRRDRAGRRASAASTCTSTRPARSKPPSPATATPTRLRSPRW